MQIHALRESDVVLCDAEVKIQVWFATRLCACERLPWCDWEMGVADNTFLVEFRDDGTDRDIPITRDVFESERSRALENIPVRPEALRSELVAYVASPLWRSTAGTFFLLQ